MSVLNFPSNIAPNSIEWFLKFNTQSFSSPLNGVTQTVALAGDKWFATLTFGNKIGEPARRLRAFFSSLRGKAGRFYLTPFDHPIPYGNPSGNPLVDGSDQIGSSLDIKGCTANISGWLLAGDFVQIGNELKMITEDVDIDSDGKGTLKFEPSLRVSPIDGSSIITSYPKAIMMLSDDNQTKWSAAFGTATEKLYAFSIACEEAIDI